MSDGSASGLRVDRHGAVGLLVLDRPERRNAIDHATRSKLVAVLDELDSDIDIRIVVVTGTGSAFCAGVDLKDIPQSDDPAWIRSRGRLVEPLERFSKPLMAAVNGPAVGGGFEIALCCELRVAAPEASFQLPEVRIGSMPGSGGTQRIFGALPSAVAWKVLLGGEAIDAKEAHRLGLVSDIFATDTLVEEAIALAARIGDGAPLSLKAIKRAGRSADQASFGLQLERALWASLSATEDRAEGRMAFRERRPPKYRGR